MQIWRNSLIDVALAILIGLAALPSGSRGEIIVTSRTSTAMALADVCDNPAVQSSRSDSLPFIANHDNAHSCEDGTAHAIIHYADSLSFAGYGLSTVFAGGSATASATHTNQDNHFDYTTGSSHGTMQLAFQVLDRPAEFVFDGSADIFATGPEAGAEAEFSIYGQNVEYVSRVFVRGDSASGPITWHEAGQLQPGYYAVSIEVRAACAPGWRWTDVYNQAHASLDGKLTLIQLRCGDRLSQHRAGNRTGLCVCA